MIVEAGTTEELKQCVYSEVYAHQYGCGHKFIVDLSEALEEWSREWWLGTRYKCCPFCTVGFHNPVVSVLIKKKLMKVYDYSSLT